jgi:multicomponent Na+:H+ antiporter subunit B
MNKVILPFTLRIICPLMAVYSFYTLLRGHNEPGGGFIGGLILGLAVILWTFVRPRSRRVARLKQSFIRLIGAGMSLMLLAIVGPAVLDEPILTAQWSQIPLPLAGKLSSVLIFDSLIYLIVALSVIYGYRGLQSTAERSAS